MMPVVENLIYGQAGSLHTVQLLVHDFNTCLTETGVQFKPPMSVPAQPILTDSFVCPGGKV